jgi:hypothetical protein
MSALMTPRRARRRPRPALPVGATGQSALFGAGSAPAVAPAPAAVEPSATVLAAPAAAEPSATALAAPAADPATTARAHRHGPTLDDLVAGAWEGLLAGALPDCIVCGTPMEPRHSAGAGIVGGRCDGCGTTVS